MTSLDTAGAQLTILKMPTDGAAKKRLLSCLDAPTEAPGWPKVLRSPSGKDRYPMNPNLCCFLIFM